LKAPLQPFNLPLDSATMVDSIKQQREIAVPEDQVVKAMDTTRCRAHQYLSTGIALLIPVLAGAVPTWEATGQVTNAPTTRNDRYGDALPAGAIARIGTLRLRHDREVASVVFSREGNILFSGADFGTAESISCWDFATGKLLRTIPGQWLGSTCLSLSPEGKTVAAVCGGRTCVRLFDAATGKTLATLERDKGHEHNFIAAAFAPDGKTLASAGNGGVRLWDVATGKLLVRFPDWGHVWTLSWSPDGKTLVGGGTYAACLGEIASGKTKWSVDLGGYGHYRTIMSPDGATVATGSHKGDVWILEASSGKVLRRLQGHNRSVCALAYSPDSKNVASGGYQDGAILLWEVNSGKKTHSLQVSKEACVWALAFSPDGKTLASGDTDQNVRLWNTADGIERLPFVGHRDAVRKTAFTSDGKRLVAGDMDGWLSVWNPTTCEQICKFAGRAGGIYAVALSPDGTKLASAGSDPKILMWDIKTEKAVVSFQGHKGEVYAVAFSPNGSQVASASMDWTIRIWDAATGKEIRELEGGTEWKWVNALAYSPDGRHLASARASGKIRLCDVATGKQILELSQHNQGAESVAFSSDGRLLASGGRDGTVRIWDAASGKELWKFLRSKPGNRPTWIRGVAFGPDCRTAVFGDDSGDVSLWEIATGEEIQVFKGHKGWVTSVAFAPDGRTVASASWDSTIVLWDITGITDRADPPVSKVSDLEILWESLAVANAKVGHRALWELVRAPRLSVPWMKEHLRAVEPLTKARLAALVADLDAAAFAVRQAAMGQIEWQGELAVPALKEVLEGKPSLELKNRVELLLTKLEGRTPPPSRIRAGRAMAILEQIGSNEARQVLQGLTIGADNAWLTREARASLNRLTRRSP
jgi:WD40 repeat protein